MGFIVKTLYILSILLGILHLTSFSNPDCTLVTSQGPYFEDSKDIQPFTDSDCNTYAFGEVSNPDILDTAKLIPYSNHSTIVKLKLVNTVDLRMNYAHSRRRW
ncbi:hypothetical protein LCGC14_1182640 [marine sediment metagenome]|uniref:Uncharacterized protein n=2 Tax=root TaxID=1 RepID=A0A831QUU4_9FLAO|nr:hypothetical protein [Pricia sp.]HEA22971.1 hypothetical protein [Pricia antarctica]